MHMLEATVMTSASDVVQCGCRHRLNNIWLLLKLNLCDVGSGHWVVDIESNCKQVLLVD